MINQPNEKRMQTPLNNEKGELTCQSEMMLIV